MVVTRQRKKITTINLSEEQTAKLNALSAEWGIPNGELIRFAIYYYFMDNNAPDPMIYNVMKDLEKLLSNSHRIAEQTVTIKNREYIYRFETKKWVCIT